MATRLYFHNAAFDTATYPGSYPDTNGELQDGGAAFPGTPSVTYGKEDASSVHRSMNKTKGSSQTTMSWSSSASTLTQMNYITKFISEPLSGITTIDDNQWTGLMAYSESNLSANVTFMAGVLYVWRPSTNSLVGHIEDYTGLHTTGEPSGANTEKLFKGNFTAGTSAEVTGVQDGDVIILEIYSRHQQSSATAYTIGFYFDGTNEHASDPNNTTVSDVASYIETPQDLTFVTDAPADIDMDVTDTMVLANKFITKV